MGLWRGKVQVYLQAFMFCPKQTIKKHQRIKRKDTYKKKERGKKGKVSIKKHSIPRLGLGGLCHKKRIEESLSANHIDKYRKRQYVE
jgi:hypothetical protein